MVITSDWEGDRVGEARMRQENGDQGSYTEGTSSSVPQHSGELSSQGPIVFYG